jgi:hypothetical protein
MTDTANRGRRAATQALAAVGVAAGVALLTRPEQIVDRLCPEYPPSRRWIARVLGARLVVQHAAVLVAPTAAVLRAASTVDLVHAASVVPLLALPHYRRAAVISGGMAAAYTAAHAAIAAAAGGSERR